MNTVSVEIVGLQALQKRLTEMPKEIKAGARDAMRKAFKEAARFTTTNYLTGGTSSSRLATRTKHLKDSVKFKVSGAGEKIDGEFGSYDTPYAETHEKGKTIYGKPWLAIPLRAVKTSAGVARITAGALRSNPNALGYVSTFVMNGIIFGQRAAGGNAGNNYAGKNGRGAQRIDPLFVLRRSVRIPARPWLRPTFDRCIIPMLNAEFDRMLGLAVNK